MHGVNMKTLYVYYFDRYAGELTKADNLYVFQYDKTYLESAEAAPLAFLFPLQRGAFKSDVLFPFFESLLSEGWLKHMQTRLLNISENDEFSLLAECGADTIGAVSLYKEKR